MTKALAVDEHIIILLVMVFLIFNRLFNKIDSVEEILKIRISFASGISAPGAEVSSSVPGKDACMIADRTDE